TGSCHESRASLSSFRRRDRQGAAAGACRPGSYSYSDRVAINAARNEISMATNVKITSIKQLQPISAPASVQIQFVVLGILPDLVQIYASGVSGQIGAFVDKVDINPPENTYGTIITLAAGTAFFISLCPRTVTNGILDDQMDDQAWETF